LQRISVFPPEARGCSHRTFFDAVLTPDDLLLLISLKNEQNAQAFEQSLQCLTAGESAESGSFEITACSIGARPRNTTRTLQRPRHEASSRTPRVDCRRPLDRLTAWAALKKL
jgi:hypothetical protein